MPIYAYRCEACGHAKDVLQKISEPVLTVCPACGAEAFKKQLTAAGFQLKGSGWYVTDFRGGAQTQGDTAAKPSSGSTEAPKADAPAASPAAPAASTSAAAPAPSPSGPSSTGAK
ncbi:MAG TPA: FmdB family zinc ribbon protein [Rhizobacter sp.]|jgi:putative FmdB family regulatory protein|nr:FmdB family zinc ribbon protein [Rhizobacter sp.]